MTKLPISKFVNLDNNNYTKKSNLGYYRITSLKLGGYNTHLWWVVVGESHEPPEHFRVFLIFNYANLKYFGILDSTVPTPGK